jgi:hypothetical protein
MESTKNGDVIAKRNYQMGGKQPNVAGSDPDGEPKKRFWAGRYKR